VAILESYRLAHDQRNVARILEQTDKQLLQGVMVVSRERLPTKELGWLLMETKRQRILELNARTLVEQALHEDERIAMNADFIIGGGSR
jgi:hypothetical protein